MSPDGRRLAAVAGRDPGNLETVLLIANADGTEPREVFGSRRRYFDRGRSAPS
jgi:hypothetical protein